MNLNPSPIRLLGVIGHIIKKGLTEDAAQCFYLDYLYSIGGYQPQFLSPNTRYRFKIIIVAENATCESQTYELFWTGIWKDDKEEMFKEVTIRPV
jgi:hypothetical protein